MADKEATVYIVDLGSTMAEKSNGREESNLDWSLHYVWAKIGDVAASGRKTLCAGVVGLRTDATDNPLDTDEGYENISVLQQLGPIGMPALRSLRTSLRQNRSASGDAISAIVVAVDMIERFTKKQKWTRKICLVTDGRALIDGEDTSDIAKKISELGIQLIIFVDFDDPDFGFKEEDKPAVKAVNETILRCLVTGCSGGSYATVAEAINDTEQPRVKLVKPYKSYEGCLTLGNPTEFPAAVIINIERYFKTHLASPTSASTVVIQADQSSTQADSITVGGNRIDGAEFAAVKNARTYRVDDPTAPGGKRDVEFESLAKGYEYGRTAVHISESEYNITKLESKQSFTIIGFIQRNKYESFLNMGDAGVTLARKGDNEAQVALSSFIWALSELESYAVARIVGKDGKDPQLALLAPCIDGELECLYDVPLPFAEDVRGYQFPPLDRVITVSGAAMTEHRLLPGDDLNAAMSNCVDAMDISTFGIDEDGNPAEYARIDEMYNPMIHRLTDAVRHRALFPDQPVPDIPKTLLRFAAPVEELLARARHEIDALVETAEVKKVPPKAKGRQSRDAAKPISGLDIEALLGSAPLQRRGVTISAENAVPDFKRVLGQAAEAAQIEDAIARMGELVRELISNSFGFSNYDRALEYMGAMRSELVTLDEPNLYNRFITDLKKRLLSGELGGDRRDMWYKIKTTRLGLVDQSQLESSLTTAAQAEEFYKTK